MARYAPYLLDTNILILLLRNNWVGQAIASSFDLIFGFNHCVISIVTVGEMYSFTRKLAWGEKKQADLKQLLEELTWLDINHPDVLDAYAELDDWSERANRKIGKNDLWIAATAKVTGARC